MLEPTDELIHKIAYTKGLQPDESPEYFKENPQELLKVASSTIDLLRTHLFTLYYSSGELNFTVKKRVEDILEEKCKGLYYDRLREDYIKELEEEYLNGNQT